MCRARRPSAAGVRKSLLAERGMLILDVIDGRIVYVEILGRPPMRRASPQVTGGAEGEHPDL